MLPFIDLHCFWLRAQVLAPLLLLAAAQAQGEPLLAAARLQVAQQLVTVQVGAAHPPVALHLQLPHQVSKLFGLIVCLKQQNCQCQSVAFELYLTVCFTVRLFFHN